MVPSGSLHIESCRPSMSASGALNRRGNVSTSGGRWALLAAEGAAVASHKDMVVQMANFAGVGSFAAVGVSGGTAWGPAWASRFRSCSASFAHFNVRDDLERRLPLEPGTTITALKVSFPAEPHEQVRLDSPRSRVQVLQCLRIIVCPPW